MKKIIISFFLFGFVSLYSMTSNALTKIQFCNEYADFVYAVAMLHRSGATMGDIAEYTENNNLDETFIDLALNVYTQVPILKDEKQFEDIVKQAMDNVFFNCYKNVKEVKSNESKDWEISELVWTLPTSRKNFLLEKDKR